MLLAFRGGHCKKVRGAKGYLDEYDEMQKLYDELEVILKKHKHEIINCNSNESSQNADLKYGVNKANAAKADKFFSLHMNAFDGNAYGTECWTLSSNGPATQTAKRIVKNISSVGFKSRGVKHKSFYELRNTNMSAIIVEVCFCDNKDDSDRMKKVGYKKLARLIANAFDQNIPIEEPTPSKEIYRVRISWQNSSSQKGAFSSLENAIECCKKYEGYHVYDSDGYLKFSNNPKIITGSKVKIIGKQYATGQVIPEWAKNKSYTVSKISENKALLKEITSWVLLKDLKLI